MVEEGAFEVDGRNDIRSRRECIVQCMYHFTVYPASESAAHSEISDRWSNPVCPLFALILGALAVERIVAIKL